MLRQYHPGPLLPNLQNLCWSSYQLAPFATLLITSSLSSLVFEPVEEEAVRAVLAKVRRQASGLQLLAFPEAELDVLASLEEDISITICSLTNLTTLDFNYAHLIPDAFIHLSRLPELTSFSVSLTNRNGDCWKSAEWGGFPALETLDISSLELLDDMSYPPGFLNSISVARLTELTMISDVPAHIDDVAELFSSLGQFSKLKRLTLMFYDEDADWGDQRLRGSALLPLTNLRSMADFCIEYLPIEITSAEVRKLAESWPHLQCFTLLPTLDLSYSHLQLEDLALFAKHCLDIEYLNVELESPPAGWRYAPNDDRPISNLPRLCLSRSHISASVIQPVAEFLADTFPFAKVFHHLPGWRHTPEDEEAARVLNKIWELKKRLNYPLIKRLRRERKREKKRKNRQAKETAAE
ncbi:uncharacterized protein PHACADRAFT_260378 [Phanerochaete carnosa HHB-10118-sp]|uniref:F-box domain-containing protein n=1 Tax=Phanerochaete carnosa (strain HHB-10118-sp) TaxID=650164 RepID=K5W402_PHACS|nr:uncharacterized protein PHACADRAFT_260378 [Phanerochaete carnosa HHB-10118-sp]EKM53835.1 hypothetical protein PHACADRAFT_260378 [Phanerochaete carnosa HHB-10118-sp]